MVARRTRALIVFLGIGGFLRNLIFHRTHEAAGRDYG